MIFSGTQVERAEAGRLTPAHPETCALLARRTPEASETDMSIGARIIRLAELAAAQHALILAAMARPDDTGAVEEHVVEDVS